MKEKHLVFHQTYGEFPEYEAVCCVASAVFFFFLTHPGVELFLIMLMQNRLDGRRPRLCTNFEIYTQWRGILPVRESFKICCTFTSALFHVLFCHLAAADTSCKHNLDISLFKSIWQTVAYAHLQHIWSHIRIYSELCSIQTDVKYWTHYTPKAGSSADKCSIMSTS